MDTELSWYAALLGQVRDRGVQRARFGKMIADLPDEQVLGPVAARIEQYLLGEQVQHQQAIDKAMNGRRYLALLTESARWVNDPPFTALATGKPTALKGAVRAAAKKVTKHLAAGLGPTGDDEELHKARKAGKRARYAAELAGPVLGKKTKDAVKQYQELQDILGDQPIGSVTEVWQRLATAFPELASAQVEQIVRQSHGLFTGKPIRDFVPVLVERKARHELSEQRKESGQTARRSAQLTV